MAPPKHGARDGNGGKGEGSPPLYKLKNCNRSGQPSSFINLPFFCQSTGVHHLQSAAITAAHYVYSQPLTINKWLTAGANINSHLIYYNSFNIAYTCPDMSEPAIRALFFFSGKT